MPFMKLITKSDSFITYAKDAGINLGVSMHNCFSAGLASVWLYMKAIGLESEFFTLLKRSEKRPAIYKELLYLLYMTNSNSDYFPHIPENILKLEIPGLVVDAQVEIAKPDFQLVMLVSRENLLDALRGLAIKNRMIRIGNKKLAVGVMFQSGSYCVYHAGNSTALEFKNITDCAEAIAKHLKNTKSETIVVMESYALAGMPVAKPPIALDIFAKQAKNYTDKELQECAYNCVLANDLKILEFIKSKISLNFTKHSIDLLRLAILQPRINPKMIDFLIKAGIDRKTAIESFLERKAARHNEPGLAEIHRLLHDDKEGGLLFGIGAPGHKPKQGSSPRT